MIAFTAEAAIGLPPFVPSTVINGMIPFSVNACLESAAPTNPTGIPMTAAGRIPSSFMGESLQTMP